MGRWAWWGCALGCAAAPGGLRRWVMAAAIAGLLVTAGASAPAAAQRGPWGDTLGLTQVSRLFTPDSGAFFAAARGELYRSDDAGATWRKVDLPDAGPDPVVAVHPIDHRIIYVGGTQGLYKTDDDAATWKLVLESPKVRGVTVSAAAPDVVYVQLADRAEPTGPRQLMLSRDGGGTWTEQEWAATELNQRCPWQLDLLAAHPSVAGRLFRAAHCVGGSETPHFRASEDEGATWTERDVEVFVDRLAGGRGVDPSRLYMSGRRVFYEGGSMVLASVDGGLAWSPILSFTGGQAGGPLAKPSGPVVQVGGIAVDPNDPARVWIALNRLVDLGGGHQGWGGEVVTSADGGATWADLGGAVLPRVADLALGVDGKHLFAGTAGGVFRLGLP
jgi:photosystem II stability/assembly factor-like uncharacterized protein